MKQDFKRVDVKKAVFDVRGRPVKREAMEMSYSEATLARRFEELTRFTLGGVRYISILSRMDGVIAVVEEAKTMIRGELRHKVVCLDQIPTARIG